MSWFQLDAESVLARARTSGVTPALPSLGGSVLRGICGFMLVSLAGFAPWVLAGHWFSQTVGEAGLYAVCAVCFIGLSGLLLRGLIIGPGSFGRFYKLFGVAFAAYAIAWIIGWMSFRGNRGGIIGLFAGTALMGCIFARAFDAPKATLKVIIALFVLNALGYFLGGWIERTVVGAKNLSVFGMHVSTPLRITLAKLLWGVSYGVGFGAGLGMAFYWCQARTRSLVQSRMHEEGRTEPVSLTETS